MEDKRISEKESLELIARMIRETQDNTARYAAYPLLIWGYTTVAISLVVWYFYLQTGVWQINFLWFALPVIAGQTVFHIMPDIPDCILSLLYFFIKIFCIFQFLLYLLFFRI